ncbi:unnamed protein product [Rotaria magnacalcarata]|uniref:Uncharacterized protein n=3 Tax=Rotaria magnacalcarata TaxID=392030 RepID=A0A819X0C4_9BILA|nr:unnamed protein product [Rotaria magnacalcarata]CAF4304531.1 unnamed protein product [Rotaria magnacalcarata]CAF4393650.1 unnamed protein product [Rotaria magnacalcarata]
MFRNNSVCVAFHIQIDMLLKQLRQLSPYSFTNRISVCLSFELFQMSTDISPLKSEELQLFELARLSNITIDERMFKIILELLKLNIKPEAIIQVLKVLAKQGLTSTSS